MRSTKTTAPTTITDAVRTYANALESNFLPKWTRGKEIDYTVEVRRANMIEITFSLQFNCTVEIVVRLTYDSFYSLAPWAVEATTPSGKWLNSLRIAEYADFFRNVGRVMERVEDVGNSKRFRKA